MRRIHRPPTARRGLLEAIGERTFGWLMRHRRLVRDSENTETSAAAWIFIALIRSQPRRLAEFLSKNEFSDLLLETLQLK